MDLVELAGGDVSGDEWIGDAVELACLQVYIGAADLAVLDREQGGARLQIGFRQIAQLDGCAGCGDHGCLDR